MRHEALEMNIDLDTAESEIAPVMRSPVTRDNWIGPENYRLFPVKHRVRCISPPSFLRCTFVCIRKDKNKMIIS